MATEQQGTASGQEGNGRAATMADLANLAEHITMQLQGQVQQIQGEMKQLVEGMVKSPPSVPLDVSEMQHALSRLPHFPQLLAFLDL